MRILLSFLFLAFSQYALAQISKPCACTRDSSYSFSHYTMVNFSNHINKFNADTLNHWNETERLKITSLGLSGFDSIPKELAVFENIERIHLFGTIKLENLQVFNHLRILVIEEGDIEIDTSSGWLKQIEVIITNKTKLSGIQSFKALPQLKEVRLSFSGFDVFPSDFESMQCLGYFSTGAHTMGTIDLSKIDLAKMPCLKSVEFHSWRDNITGLPKGLTRKKKIHIHYDKMKAADKTRLKNY